MARKSRASALDSKSAREKVKRGVRVWVRVDRFTLDRPGVSLGYYRAKRPAGGLDPAGSWLVCATHGRDLRAYGALGLADDGDLAPDGVRVLDFEQAREKARSEAPLLLHLRRSALLEQPAPATGANVPTRIVTVADAVARYLADRETAGAKSVADLRRLCAREILPVFGSKRIDRLTTIEINDWMAALAARPRRGRLPRELEARLRSEDPRIRKAARETMRMARRRAERPPVVGDPEDLLRRRRQTANKTVRIFKALLNHAWRVGEVPDAATVAWRRVAYFKGVDQPRVRILSDDEVRRFVNACDEEFRPLALAAVLTGARYGELIRLRVGDVDHDEGMIFVAHSKSGRSRHVPLSPEGRRWFDIWTAGRSPSEFVFVRSKGAPWGQSHQQRPVARACTAAGIDPPITFHLLRHIYGGALVREGVSTKVVGDALGHTSTRMVEKHYAHLKPSDLKRQIEAHLPKWATPPTATVATMAARRSPRRKAS